MTDPTPLSPPQPVPVSERLPGPGDYNAQGECWWFHPSDGETGSFWCLYEGHSPPGDTHWLPAQALPVPTREVEP